MGFVKVATSISSLSTEKSGQKNPIPKEFDDVFAGIGKLPGKVEIHVKKNAIPSVNPVRRIPFALHERVKSELERLEKLDIIERVVTPTEWVNSIVAVEKSDDLLRLCLDPRELNKSIQRPYYPMPTFEDIAAKIHGHNKFSKLDATSGYLMLALTEKSSLVTIFNTPFGRYKYKRMPFGLICAQDEFQQKMEETFGNLKGNFDEAVKILTGKLDAVIRSQKDINKSIQSLTGEIATLKKDASDRDIKIGQLEKELEDQKLRCDQLENQVLGSDVKDRKLNLLIHGIPTERPSQPVEENVKHFLSVTMDISDPIQITKCYRMLGGSNAPARL
ncbi:hypothetical protein QYM36_019534, partial [Artemia franciscana]